MNDNQRADELVIRRDPDAPGPVVVDVRPEAAGWDRSGLTVLHLTPGQTHTFATGDAETLVLSLSGSAQVRIDGTGSDSTGLDSTVFDLVGRPDVFSGPSDVVYAPRDARVSITSTDGARLALPSARCENRLEPAHLPADRVPVELRGAGQASRQVNNFGVPGVLEADRIIACEVLTPGGNWSSYPPHKHDEEREGEARLEEIYYFEVAAGPAGPGLAYQRVYGHEKAEIDVLAEVRDGDVVLIPHGWHGPSMAAPGYDLYYLNVMAGPGDERAWLICDDPAHTWVRDSWPDLEVDPRLPFGREVVR